jgi:hypothetical protein
VDDFLTKHVPTLLGNFIARLLAPLTLNASVEDMDKARKEQRRFIVQYVDAVANALTQIKKAKINFDSVGEDEDHEHLTVPPQDLDITNFLPLSRRLSDLNEAEINKLKRNIRRRARKELGLFEEISSKAKPPKDKADPGYKKELDALYTAISNLIEGYLLTAVEDRAAIIRKHNEIFGEAKLGNFEVCQITAYINLLNFHTRISKLTNYNKIVEDLKTTNAPLSPNALLQKFPEINFSFETLQNCLDAIQILKGAIEADDNKQALKKPLSKLGTLGELINP